MTLDDMMRPLDEVAQQLPFGIDDYDEVNATYRRWLSTESPDDLETLYLWLYCFCRRYVIVKLIRNPQLAAAEADKLISDAFRRGRKSLRTVKDPDRFASYVSVLCRNVFVSLHRKNGTHVHSEVQADTAVDPDAHKINALDEHDKAVRLYAVLSALPKLPDSLRTVIEMRYLQEKSYEEISEVTGYGLPTLRSYVHKALIRLRSDPAVAALIDEWRD